MGLEQFLPAAFVHALGWKSRFRALGLSRADSWRAAFSRNSHEAYVASRIDLIPRACRQNLSLVVDVGANKGQWLGALLRFTSPTRVEVFEPIPEELAHLRKEFGSRSGVRLHGEALGDHPGVSMLKVLRQSDLTSFLEPSPLLKSIYRNTGLDVVSTVEVPVTTLDIALPGEPVIDILKIDVQGAERAVLRGAKETLRRTRVLLVETNLVPHYEGDDSLLTLGTLLHDEFGFELWDMTYPTHNDDGRALWCDTVFVNPRAPGGVSPPGA